MGPSGESLWPSCGLKLASSDVEENDEEDDVNEDDDNDYDDDNNTPLWSSGQSFWLQIQRSRVRFPALPDFLSNSGSGTGSTQPREVN